MSALLCERTQEPASKKGRVRTILRVAEGDRYVGDILLDEKNRVWRHADTIPPDIVLKALGLVSKKDESCGTLLGRDKRTYTWFVVGAMADVGRAAENEGGAETKDGTDSQNAHQGETPMFEVIISQVKTGKVQRKVFDSRSEAEQYIAWHEESVLTPRPRRRQQSLRNFRVELRMCEVPTVRQMPRSERMPVAA